MRFFIPLTLAGLVVAVPQPHSALIPRERLAAMTLGEAGDVCGAGQTVNCCNDESKEIDASPQQGLIGNLLNGVLKDGVLGQCSSLDINVIGATGLLNDKCKGSVACCQHSGSSGNGLINVGLPCIALGSLL